MAEIKKINSKIHWEKCKGNREQNIAYCSEGGNTFGNLVKKKLKIIENLKDWQRGCWINILRKPLDNLFNLWYNIYCNLIKTYQKLEMALGIKWKGEIWQI